MQSPGQEILKDPTRHDELKAYVQDVVGRFRNDRRVQVWDIFNEPDNPVPQLPERGVEKQGGGCSAATGEGVCLGARSQSVAALTSGVWIGNWPDPAKLTPMERCQLEESDVISYHCYGPVEEMERVHPELAPVQSPVLCTEYMARPDAAASHPVLGLPQGGTRRRLQLGIRGWQIADHLSVGFVEQDVHQRAPRLGFTTSLAATAPPTMPPRWTTSNASPARRGAGS